MVSEAVISIISKLVKSIPRDKRGPVDTKPISHYLDKIIYVLETGIPWRKLVLSSDDLHYTSYHKKFLYLRNNFVFQRAYDIIIQIMKKLNYFDSSKINNLYVDASMIKNYYGSDSTGPNHYDRGRSGNKISVVVTDSGIPLGIKISTSNIHDSTLLVGTLDKIKITIAKSRIIADKGYVGRRLKNTLKTNYDVDLVTPLKKNQVETTQYTENYELLSKRNIVENFFSWLKHKQN